MSPLKNKSDEMVTSCAFFLTNYGVKFKCESTSSEENPPKW